MAFTEGPNAGLGKFTKDEADVAAECINEIFSGLSRAKKMENFGELNEVLIFIGKAKAIAPVEDGGAYTLPTGSAFQLGEPEAG